jgi:hypothetical protein
MILFARWWCDTDAPKPIWLDVEDTARMCVVTPSAVYGWINDGYVRATASNVYRRGKYLVDVNTLPGASYRKKKLGGER